MEVDLQDAVETPSTRFLLILKAAEGRGGGGARTGPCRTHAVLGSTRRERRESAAALLAARERVCRKAPAVQKSTPLRSVDPFVFMAATTPIAVPALGSTPKTAEGARQLYDEWAESYDHSLESWRYRLPQRVAEVLKSLGCDASSRILDLGCGTGMSGAALRAAGLGTAAAGVLVGVDISQASLGMAEKRKVYTELVLANLEESFAFSQRQLRRCGMRRRAVLRREIRFAFS